MNNNCSPYYKAKASLLWGKLIHLMYDSCLVCGRSDVILEAHHLIRKRNSLTRNDFRNGILLCSFDHRSNKKCSPHGGPSGFKIFLKKKHPDRAIYIELNKYKTGKANFKYDAIFLQKLIEGNDPNN